MSRKYSRTYHFPFSPGTTSDDRINHQFWEDLSHIDQLVHTEKLDGENTCLNRYGVFARSHAAPTQHPWAGYLKERWEMLKHDLGDLEIFGENLYAEHSIRYTELPSHFFVFAIRENDQWLSWEEVKFYASMLDFPTVPELSFEKPEQPETFKRHILDLVAEPSRFGSTDVWTDKPCTMEGLVSRNVNGFHVNDFSHQVFKYVRKNHVKTDQHWSRNWKRARLAWEKSNNPCGK